MDTSVLTQWSRPARRALALANGMINLINVNASREDRGQYQVNRQMSFVGPHPIASPFKGAVSDSNPRHLSFVKFSKLFLKVL